MDNKLDYMDVRNTVIFFLLWELSLEVKWLKILKLKYKLLCLQEFSLLPISLCYMSHIFWSRFLLDVWHLPENLELLHEKHLVTDFPCCYNYNFYVSVLVVAVDKHGTFNFPILFLLQGLNNPHWWKLTNTNIFNSKGPDFAFYIQNWFSLNLFVICSSTFNSNLLADPIWMTSGGRDK